MPIHHIKKKQDEKLKEKSLEEKMKAAARLATLEMKNTHNIQELDQLASGKSDKDGNMDFEDENQN
ncbi:MAG: hypothetical protein ACRBBR_05985 [Cellvibrionaceae bacterium]